MKVVNVDCDGVLYDFTASMIRAFVSQGYTEAPTWSHMRTWNLEETWPVSKTEIYKTMHEGILDGIVFGTGPLLDENIPSVMRTLQSGGWHIRIVTAKTFPARSVTLKARQATLEWLDRYDVPYDTIAFSDSHGKADFRADAVIDDKPDLSWVQPGSLNLLYNHPWNKEVRRTDVLRVNDWNEIMGVLV